MATLLLYAPGLHLREAMDEAVRWRSAGHGQALVRDVAGLVSADQVEPADVVAAHPDCLEQVRRFYPLAEPWGTVSVDAAHGTAVGGASAARDGSLPADAPAPGRRRARDDKARSD